MQVATAGPKLPGMTKQVSDSTKGKEFREPEQSGGDKLLSIANKKNVREPKDPAQGSLHKVFYSYLSLLFVPI